MTENKGDLISREALKKALHNFFEGKIIDEPTYILRDVFCHIDNAPTVEPTFGVFKAICCEDCDKNKRPQGEWINKRTIKHDGEFYCSNCDFELESFIQGVFYNFCPNCGAQMVNFDSIFLRRQL